MATVEAIYQGGVFKPLDTVSLTENQRVRLEVCAVAGQDVLNWIDEVEAFQKQIVAEQGILPDSAPDIAQDRRREL